MSFVAMYPIDKIPQQISSDGKEDFAEDRERWELYGAVERALQVRRTHNTPALHAMPGTLLSNGRHQAGRMRVHLCRSGRTAPLPQGCRTAKATPPLARPTLKK